MTVFLALAVVRFHRMYLKTCVFIGIPTEGAEHDSFSYLALSKLRDMPFTGHFYCPIKTIGFEMVPVNIPADFFGSACLGRPLPPHDWRFVPYHVERE